MNRIEEINILVPYVQRIIESIPNDGWINMRHRVQLFMIKIDLMKELDLILKA